MTFTYCGLSYCDNVHLFRVELYVNFFTSLVMCAGYLVTLTAKLPHFVWIGLNDMKRRNYFEWQDNSEVGFTHWGPQQPDENVHSSNPDDRVGSWHTEKTLQKVPNNAARLRVPKTDQFLLILLFSPLAAHWFIHEYNTNSLLCATASSSTVAGYLSELPKVCKSTHQLHSFPETSILFLLFLLRTGRIRLVRDLFLCCTVCLISLAKLGHQTHIFDVIFEISPLRDILSTLCVRAQQIFWFYRLCVFARNKYFGSLLCNGLWAPVWRNSTLKMHCYD